MYVKISVVCLDMQGLTVMRTLTSVPKTHPARMELHAATPMEATCAFAHLDTPGLTVVSTFTTDESRSVCSMGVMVCGCCANIAALQYTAWI